VLGKNDLHFCCDESGEFRKEEDEDEEAAANGDCEKQHRVRGKGGGHKRGGQPCLPLPLLTGPRT
jgi:hypothetical protein